VATSILSRAVRNARAMMRSGGTGEWGDSTIPPNSEMGIFGGPSAPGSAMAIGTVLSCVKVLHDDFRALTFSSYTGSKLGARKTAITQPPIVAEPFGPDLPPGAGFGQIIVSVAMRGNSFLFVTATDSLGFPTQVQILHPDKVKPKRLEGKKVFDIGGEIYGPDKVKHITGMMMPGAVAGVDVLTAQRLTFQLAANVTAYADGFFGGGGSPAGVINVPGSGDRKKARQVKDAWEAGNAGVANAHRPAVLFGGAKWTQLSVTPENAQFLETRRLMREEICGLFGVPLQRIQAIVDNSSQGGGKGVDAIDHGYVTHTCVPLATAIEEVWDPMLPGGQGSWSAFDFNGFLRAAAKERAEIAQIHRVAAIRPADEIRADEGWEPLPDGMGANPHQPLNSNTSPTGGADNAPSPGGQGGQ
jgi:HK97 family phage portal protein